LEGLEMKKVGIPIKWPFGIYYGHLAIYGQFGIFSPVLVCLEIKIWQPCFRVAQKRSADQKN
jgi:hypothetical protein